jgi:Uma2 family endonuclease
MPLPRLKPDEKFTYADYLAWPDEERWELIEGEAYNMSPGPGTTHQTLTGTIFRKISDFLEGKKCRVFLSPLDVRLKECPADSDEDIFTVVQPDLLVVCDRSKIDARGINGAPDLVVEILSESTAYKDQTKKLALYEKHGVREYWIVNPGAKYILIYRAADNGLFDKPEYCRSGDIITSAVLEGFSAACDDIFIDAIYEDEAE